MFIGEERVPFNTCSIHFLLRPMYSAQKIQNVGTIFVVKRNCSVGLWKKRVSWIQKIMMTLLSWRRLQPIWDAIFTKIKVFMKIFCRDIDKLIRLMNLKATPGWFEGPLKLYAEKYKPKEELFNDTHLKQLLWKGEWQKTLFNYRCKILCFKAGNNRNTQRTRGWDVMFSSINTTYHWHTWHSCDKLTFENLEPSHDTPSIRIKYYSRIGKSPRE